MHAWLLAKLFLFWMSEGLLSTGRSMQHSFFSCYLEKYPQTPTNPKNLLILLPWRDIFLPFWMRGESCLGEVKGVLCQLYTGLIDAVTVEAEMRLPFSGFAESFKKVQKAGKPWLFFCQREPHRVIFENCTETGKCKRKIVISFSEPGRQDLSRCESEGVTQASVLNFIPQTCCAFCLCTLNIKYAITENYLQL